jgi:spermidine/putrescine transport system substrate-binding protein
VAAPAGAWLLAACGGDEDADEGGAPGTATAQAEPEGTAHMLNAPGWIGEHEVERFKENFPGANIRQSAEFPAQIAGIVQLIKNSPDTFDFSLGDQSVIVQAEAADVYQEPDWDQIPNIKNVDETFREAYRSMPNDYGKVVIGFRKDVVTEPLTSWADFWELAPKYSGKVNVLDTDRDTLGAALKYLGYSGNSENETELTKAKEALIQIKPHLNAVTTVNTARDLAKGVVVIGLTHDWAIAASQLTNKDIDWVFPEEGSVGYLEGWWPVKGSDELDVVYAFMNFHHEPENYADFINTTGSPWVNSAAEPLIKEEFRTNPVLQPDPAILDKLEYETFLGEATALWSRAWEEFKAA